MRVFMGCLLLVMANTASALELGELWRRADQQGMNLLDDDKPAEAAKAFDDARWKGVSHFRAGNFEEAARAFGESDEQIYNQATSAVRAGDYQSAIEQFEQLLEQNPDHADARHNLDIARQLAGQDAEQQPSGEQDKSADPQESGEKGEDQNQSAEQDGEGEQQASSQDQQSGEQNGEQNPAADDPAQSAGTDDGEQQAEQNAASEPDSADGQEEDDASQQLVAAEDPLSEVDQATEQWLRRIPDDPSQLLRGKIQLKHRTDYRDVGDMVEPW